MKLLVFQSLLCVCSILALFPEDGSEGWIFNRYIDLESAVSQLEPSSAGGLIISAAQSLYATEFVAPDGRKSMIFDHFDEKTSFTYAPTTNQVIFIDENKIHFASLNSPQFADVDRLSSMSSIIKNGPNIYFYDVDGDYHLYRYNLEEKVLTQGPELIDRRVVSCLLKFSRTGRLFAMVDNRLTIVDPPSLSIIQQITVNTILPLSMEFSPSDTYIQVISTHLTTVYGFSQASGGYELLNIFYYNDVGNEFGIYCHDDGRCKMAEFSSTLGYESVLTLKQFNVSSFGFAPLSSLDSYLKTVLSDDGKTVLQFQMWGSGYALFQIAEEGLEKKEEGELQFDIMGEGEVEYLLMTKREHLLVYQRDNGGFVWDLQNNAFVCKIQAPSQSRYVAMLDGHIYYLEEGILGVVDLQFGCKQERIPVEVLDYYKFEVTNERIYIYGHEQSVLLIYSRSSPYSMVTRLPIDLYSSITQSRDRLFSRTVEGNRSFIVTIDQHGAELGRIEVYCGNEASMIIAASQFLLFSCINEFQVISIRSWPALQYVGTFLRPDFSFDFRPTSIPNLLFWESSATLYKFEASPWEYALFTSPRVVFDHLVDAPVFKDAETLYYFEKREGDYSINKLTLGDEMRIVRSPLGQNMSASQMQVICNGTYIAGSFLDTQSLKASVRIFSADGLQKIREIEMAEGNQLPTVGHSIDERGTFTQSLNRRAMMLDINANYTQPLRDIIAVTTPVAVSLTAAHFAVGGCTKEGKEVIELWTTAPNQFLAQYAVPDCKLIEQIFVLEKETRILVLSSDSLCEISPAGLAIIENDTSYCQLLGESKLLCKKTSGEVIVAPSDMPTGGADGFFYPSMDLSIDKRVLLEFGSDSTVSVKTLQEGQLLQRQKLASRQSHVTKLAISADNRKIITYDCTEASAVVWEWGSCPDGRFNADGFCVCRGSLADLGSSCGCTSGNYASADDACEACDFLCSECERTSGNCLSVNVAGVLMLVAAVLAVVLLGLVAVRCARRRRERRVELLSELLESEASA